MKKLLLFLLAFTAIGSWCYAQQQEVSGKVTSAEDGVGLPGVTIVIVGTTQGTVTDNDGNYRLSVPANSTLKFSFIGYKAQEFPVGSKSVIDVVLAAESTQLSEVVVTALGVERETKSLNYSVTNVDAEEMQKARENNLSSQLEGRVAGVNVSSGATGPSGSTRVIIRGNKSLQGDNQPLYVVDGIPMNNRNFGQAGLWGGQDQGDGMTSLDPEDIQSITVLKGANAAALYGARAANGVINIITKKGKARKGIGIEYNSNVVFETINDLTDLQEKYGSGWIDNNGVIHRPSTPQEAYDSGFGGWGPALDGTPNIQWDGATRPYSLVGMHQNIKDYYETGTAWTNSIALTGGSETQNFRASMSRMQSSYTIPKAGFNRTNLSLSTNSKFGKKITLVAKVLYSSEYTKNRPFVSDSPGNGGQQIWNYGNELSVLNAKGDPNKLGAIPAETAQNLLTIWGKVPGEEYQEANNPWGQNPYWTAYQMVNSDHRDRIITSGQLRYDITDFLYVQGTAGLDWYTRRATSLVPEGTGYQRGGARTEAEQRVYEVNYEWMLGFDKTFGKVSVNAFVGGNKMNNAYEYLGLTGDGYNVQFFPAINNTKSHTWSYDYNSSGINSLFGSVELGYNNYLFLTATARQDWFSVLNPENNHILYPSVGGSFVFSDAMQTLPSWLSFGKVRASWAQVGSVQIDPYNTNLTYSLNGSPHLGHTMASFSSAGGQLGTIPNPDLRPPTSTEIEFGADVRFFQDRLGLDFTYYHQKTTDDILQASIAPSSGFGYTYVNVGELQNNGIEILINGTPLKGAFTWDVSLNMAHNSNEVVSLIEGSTELVLEEPRTRNVYIKHVVGEPFGMITGRKQQVAPDGSPIYKVIKDGTTNEVTGILPVVTEDYQLLGNGVPDWTGGLENSFTFKNFNLSVLIDFKFGGDIFSGTNQRLTGSGLTKESLKGRTGEDPLHVKGVVNTSTTDVPNYVPIDQDLTPIQANNYWGTLNSETDGTPGYFLYDASFAKLRQLTFGYNFPREMLGKTPIQNLSLSFVGRNLAVLFKNTPNIDPEPYYTNSNSQGLDYFGLLPTRSWGFNLRATF
jgi:TonB-linked SusC/RagA family outer membrane protein